MALAWLTMKFSNRVVLLENLAALLRGVEGGVLWSPERALFRGFL
jgi:hypothetical protein